MLSGGYNKLTFGAGTRLTVRPCEYDGANDQGKVTDNLSMRKPAMIYGKLEDMGNTRFHFYKLFWYLKMFPFLILKTEGPRAS